MKVAVVGCGVSGMAAALALARDGHTVELFEAFDQPRPRGSGLLLQPSGLEALAALGLDEAVRASGAVVTRMEGRDTRGRLVLDLDYDRWRRGAHGVGVHRAALFDSLWRTLEPAGVTVRRGCRVLAVRELAHPRLVTAEDEHGPYDLAIVADGSGSTLRSCVRPKARAPQYPWGAVWADCPDPEDRFAGVLAQVYHRASIMVGVLPIGRGLRSGGPPSVSLFWSLPQEQLQAFGRDGLDAWKAEVLRIWPALQPLLASLTSPDQLRPAVYRDVSVGRWCSGAATLIGDAAHGTSPQLGQGANLGLIDAVELATAFRRARKPAVAVVLPAWQRDRRRHTAYYQLASRALTPLFQSSSRIWPWLRDLLLVPSSQAPLLRRFAGATLAGVAWFGWGWRKLRR